MLSIFMDFIIIIIKCDRQSIDKRQQPSIRLIGMKAYRLVIEGG